MSSAVSARDSLADAEWDSLAHTLKALKLGVEPKDAASRRLRVKLGIIRMLLYNKLSKFNGDNSIDLSFFIASFKTIKGVEKDFDSGSIKKTEFLMFLNVLLSKLERQKLIVKKPRAMMEEFEKMKEVVENGSTPL